MFYYKKISFVLIIVVIMIVTGCTKVNPAEEIYHHLEKAVSLENVYEEQQEPLSKAEDEEYELYDKILELAEIDEISKLASEAKELALSRKVMVEKERESIQEAYDEFSLIKPIIVTIEDVELQNSAEELVQVMNQRYEVYLELHNEYSGTIDLDLQLYDLVIKDDLTIEELEEGHAKVNSAYETINSLKEQFNQFTVQYNDLKRQFYELAEVEVVYN